MCNLAASAAWLRFFENDEKNSLITG